jgi:hypothetical protein
MAAIVFPSNPAAQSPINTFSPTSVPANTYNSYTYTWNGTAWTSSAAGGGGGTVTGVAGTAPIVSSGGSAPAISITPATSGAAGSMSAADKAKLDGAPTIVSSVTGTAPIAVATGTSTPVISANLATASDAATGTSATVLMTPQFAVPKNASGMTGAALLPGGDDGARPTTPATGMLRYNSQGGTPVKMEYYDGGAWSLLGGGGSITKFVNFDGTNLSIYDSSGVSSITRDGGSPVGSYFVNFSPAMSNTSYAIVASAGGAGGYTARLVSTNYAFTPTTTQCSVGAFNQVGTNVDPAYVSILIVE